MHRLRCSGIFVKLLTVMLDLDNISHNCCPWTKVISPRSRSLYPQSHNPRPGHNSLLSCRIWIIFHKIVVLELVHDPKMCHELDRRSYVQGQGHNAYIWQISVWAITSYSLTYCYVGFGYYLTQLLSIWVMDIYPRSRSQYTHRLKSMPRPLLVSLHLCWIWIIFQTIVVHDQSMGVSCHNLEPVSPMSSVQGQGHIAHTAIDLAWAITYYFMLDLVNSSHNCCTSISLWPKGVSCPWPKVQCIIFKVNVTMTYSKNWCPGHNFHQKLRFWWYMYFHTCQLLITPHTGLMWWVIARGDFFSIHLYFFYHFEAYMSDS